MYAGWLQMACSNKNTFEDCNTVFSQTKCYVAGQQEISLY